MPARLDKPSRVWLRWLRLNDVPLDHIAVVIERDLSVITAFINGEPYAGPIPRVPTGPPKKHRRQPAGDGPAAILGPNVRKVRRLDRLDYQADRIALLLAVHPDSVKDLLRRYQPARGKSILTTPREPAEQKARDLRERTARAERRRKARLKTEARLRIQGPPPPPDEAWRYRDDVGPDGRPLAPVRLAGPADQTDQAGRPELLPTEVPAPEPWTGSAALAIRGSVLTDAQISEARELLVSGETYPATAKRFGVSVNTLRKYVGDVGPRKPVFKVIVRPPTFCGCGCGAIVKTSGAKFARGHAPGSKPARPPALCFCGCGQAVKTRWSQFIRGHHLMRMTDADLREAKQMRADGLTLSAIADHFGVGTQTIWKIMTGRRRERGGGHSHPLPLG